MRVSPVLLVGLTLLIATGPATAREQWEGSLSDEAVERFISAYRDNPGALAERREAMRRISSEQLHRVITSLDTTHFTYLYPVNLRGYRFPDDTGIPLDELSVMAVRGGKLAPVPFQIDEYDKTGLVWIEGQNDAEPEGEIGIFDDFDELVFMFRDGGRESYDPAEHGDIEGRILREIRLDSPRNRPRYAYLVRGNPERSDADYVGADLEQGRIESTVMEMEYNPKNFINVEHAASRIGPYHGENVFDDARVEISTGLLNKNLRVGLDTEDNIRVQPVAIKDGPVRVNMLMKTRIWYLYLPTFFSRQFNLHFYEQAVRVPSRFAIDSVRTLKLFMMFLREPRIEFTMDFHNLEGAEVTFDSVHEEGKAGYVNGEMSDFEQRMREKRLPGDWLFMDSNKGWQLFFSNHLPVERNGLFDAFLEGMEMRMIYEDNRDSERDGERYPGAMPRFGLSSTGLPRTALKLMNTVPKLEFSDMDSLGEGLVALEKAAREDDALADYDAVVNEVLQELYEQERINNVEELADMFLADLDRMNFKGIPREQFNALIRDSIHAAVNHPARVDHGAVLTDMLRLAEQRAIDIRAIRYATMDNTLWFPDWVGPGGPTDFHRQVKNAPEAKIRPWIEPEETDTEMENQG